MKYVSHTLITAVATAAVMLIVFSYFYVELENRRTLQPVMLEAKGMIESMKYDDVLDLYQTQKEEGGVNTDFFVTEYPHDNNLFAVVSSRQEDMYNTLLVKFWDRTTQNSYETIVYFDTQNISAVGHWVYMTLYAAAMYNLLYESTQ